MQPLALPVDPSDQRDFNRRVAQAVNILRQGVLPAACAIPYNGTTAPEGYTTANPGVALSAGWIWIQAVS